MLGAAAPASNRADRDHADLIELAKVLDVDRSFSSDAKDAFRQGLLQLQARVGSISSAEMVLGAARLVALSGNGHTTVDIEDSARVFGLVPLRFAWFADGLYVVRAKKGFEHILGARVLSIDGRTAEQALEAVRPYLSGTLEHARSNSAVILETPALLHAIWPDADDMQVVLEIEKEGNRGRALAAAEPAGDEPIPVPSVRAIAPAKLGHGRTAESSDWNTVLREDDDLPLSLREPGRSALITPLENDGVYIRLNSITDDQRGPLAAQLESPLFGVPNGGWKWVVLDLRFNTGGDYSKTLLFTQALPARIAENGHLWLLTSNSTFSAAIVTLARAKYFAGSRAHIVGEKVGDQDEFWAELGMPIRLPNAGASIHTATGMHNWVKGCTDRTRCFWLNLAFGVAAGDLSPEVAIGWQFADYAAKRDTVLERVQMLQRQTNGR